MTLTGRWHIWIDRGGTFTDLVALGPDGQIRALKLLSVSAEHYADAAIERIRRLLGLAQDASLSEEKIAAVHMGTTVATNAILERKGARTVLVATEGLRDQLHIGYQHRPKLFVRRIDRPAPLYERVVEARERRGTGTGTGQFDLKRRRRSRSTARRWRWPRRAGDRR